MSFNETSWLFPPALNTTFRKAFDSDPRNTNSNTGDHGVYSLMLAAVQNLTLPERVDPGFKNDGWGGPDAVVAVGDVVDGTFQGNEIFYKVNCLVCTTGKGTGSIENACSNYTQAANVVHYTKMIGPSSLLYLTFPSLDQNSNIPGDACALCILTLPSKYDPDTFDDYSVPFTVLQQQGSQRRVFDAAHPTGSSVPLPSYTAYATPESTPDPHSNGANSTSSTNSGESSDTGMIVGVVVGVLGGTSLLLGLAWFLWRRRSKMRRSGDSSDSVPASSEAPINNRLRSIALQQLQCAVCRPQSVVDEPPPPYHEAIRHKEITPF